MHHHSTRALVAAAALALGACTDVPTGAPAARTPDGAAARSVSATGAELIPNSVKYRDAGGKPATGRSGSAALQAFALLGKDGVTTLDLRAVAADPARDVQGTIRHLQIKALDVDGGVIFTRNLNDVQQAQQLGGLPRGQLLRLQANVTGIDPHRTDVVTVTEGIKLRPDLAVRLESTGGAAANLPVPLSATVMELNGDVGARADCLLLVDGVERDAVRGAWIDAGDAVTCAFTHTFSPGTHDVRVEVTNVSPGDWDLENNRTTAQVTATEPPIQLQPTYVAHTEHEHKVVTYTSQWYSPWDGIFGEEHGTRTETYTRQYAGIDAGSGHLLTGDIQIRASMHTGGRELNSTVWTASGDDQGFCGARFSEGTVFYLCSEPDEWGGSFWFDYNRNAGTVTYHSTYYGREWDELTGEEVRVYHYNHSGTSLHDGPVYDWDPAFSFRVRISSGDEVFVANGDLTLERSDFGPGGGTTCTRYVDEWDGYSSSYCESILASGWRLFGHSPY